MKAIFISFEDTGPGCRHQEALRQHAARMANFPDLVLSMALEDRGRHGIVHVFTTDRAVERYLADDAFQQLSQLSGWRDFFVRRFDVLGPLQQATTERAGSPPAWQTMTTSRSRQPAEMKGSRLMGQHQAIAEYMRDLARYQRLRHTEDGDSLSDGRAGGLERFAGFVEGLSPDDVRLSTLARLTWLEHDGVVSPGPRFSSLLADIGSIPPGGFDALLDHLVHAAIDDAIDQDRSMVATFSDDLEATIH